MRYLFVVEETPDGAYKATEEWSERDLYGRGETPHEAIRHYIDLVHDG